jgi:hypothetical protein
MRNVDNQPPRHVNLPGFPEGSLFLHFIIIIIYLSLFHHYYDLFIIFMIYSSTGSMRRREVAVVRASWLEMTRVSELQRSGHLGCCVRHCL